MKSTNFTYQLKIAVVFGLTVIFTILIKMFIPDPPFNKMKMNRFWSLKVNNPFNHKYNLVAAGDSRVYRGFSPSDFQTGFPEVSAFNYGFSNGGFSKDYLMKAAKHFNDSSEIKVLLLGVTPVSVSNEAIRNEHMTTIMNEPWFNKYKYMYTYSFASYFSTYSLYDIINFVINQTRPPGYYQIFHDNGWVESDGVPHMPDRALRDYRSFFEENEFDSENYKSFINTIDSMSNSGVHIMAYRPPSCVKMEALEDSLSGCNYELFREDFKSAGATWLEIDSLNLISYDGSHLTSESSKKLSEYLGKKIRNTLIQQKVISNK